MSRAQETLDRLRDLHPKVIDLSLDRMHGLLEKLGHPEKRLPPVVHVAGTNGKGSLCAYLKAIFEASGYKPHVYISPHLVRFNERITLAGQMISDEALAQALERVESANGGAPITFFEITTAAAFVAFSQFPADVLILEVGLGGRLDATNVIDQPVLTAITPVSLDHQHYLGNTIAAIAGEKAGILKTGVPAVIGRQVPEAQSVIDLRAASVGAPLRRMGYEWFVGRDADGLHYQDDHGSLLLSAPGLLGEHQYDNAGTAVAAALALRKKFQKIGALSIAQGLRQVKWPARLQRLTEGPLVDLLPPGIELWLDGGHNQGAGEVLAGTLKEWSAEKPVLMLMGMIDSKSPSGFMAPLAPHIRAARTLSIPGEENAIPGTRLAEIAGSVGIEASPVDTIGQGLRELRDLAQSFGPASRILICGSLYLAGKVLAENKTPPV